MIPVRPSRLFTSRWKALLWAGGVLWFAIDVAGGQGSAGSAQGNDVNDITNVLMNAEQSAS